MTYGDSGGEEPPLAGSEGDLPARAIAEEKGQVGTLFGDLLGLFASFLVGLYEVSCLFLPSSEVLRTCITDPSVSFVHRSGTNATSLFRRKRKLCPW